MKTYKINGKEIQGIPIKHNGLMVYQTVNELLEALSDKEEKYFECNKHNISGFGTCSECKEKPKQEECEHDYPYLGDNQDICTKCHEPRFKQEECLKCNQCPFVEHTHETKQSISLKESCEKHVRNMDITSSEATEKIFKLIQSHLLKEIQPITNLNGEIEHEDIIKIINNITK